MRESQCRRRVSIPPSRARIVSGNQPVSATNTNTQSATPNAEHRLIPQSVKWHVWAANHKSKQSLPESLIKNILIPVNIDKHLFWQLILRITPICHLQNDFQSIEARSICMKCPKCQRQNPEDAKFCNECACSLQEISISEKLPFQSKVNESTLR
jgi:hypothetical protein